MGKRIRSAGRATISEAASRYLEAIFYIEGEGDTARPARLAEWLGVAQPTISAGLARLVRDGLIRMGPGRAVQFTPEGRRAAETIVRKHVHPLSGGPDQKGSPFGRTLHKSDLLKVIEGVNGVDFCETLTLFNEDKKASAEKIEVMEDELIHIVDVNIREIVKEAYV